MSPCPSYPPTRRPILMTLSGAHIHHSSSTTARPIYVSASRPLVPTHRPPRIPSQMSSQSSKNASITSHCCYSEMASTRRVEPRGRQRRHGRGMCYSTLMHWYVAIPRSFVPCSTSLLFDLVPFNSRSVYSISRLGADRDAYHS